MARHTLLIDADDTLWENNIFFEKSIEHFITQLEHLGYTREYIRHILNETEKRNIRQHGYGVRSFRRSLEETYLKLAGNAAKRELVQEITRIAAELEATPPHILDGVPETLAYLAKHHRLILLTKGEPAEQAGTPGHRGCALVRVRDNGRGLTPDHKLGRGLTGMRERILALGGTLSVASSDGGVTVEAIIPNAAH